MLFEDSLEDDEVDDVEIAVISSPAVAVVVVVKRYEATSLFSAIDFAVVRSTEVVADVSLLESELFSLSGLKAFIIASRLTDSVTVAPACFLAFFTAESAAFLMVKPARTKIKIALVTRISSPVRPFLAFVASHARLIKFI